MLASLPFTDEQLSVSNKKLEDAYYMLGKIYNLNLQEYENASETFLTLLERFPETEYNLEVMYFLYVINKDLHPEIAEKYKAILQSQYPNSLYAKLIDNPDYLKEAQLEDQQAGILYESAYKNYEYGNYDAAQTTLNNIIENYPASTFIDKAVLLRIILKGKKNEIIAYKTDLEKFIEEYNTSETLPFAKKLLDEANAYIQAVTNPEKSVSEATGESDEATPYKYEPKDRHFFLFVLNSEKLNTNETMVEFSDFNKANFSLEKLQVSQLLLNEDQSLFSIKEFPSKEDAMRFYDAFQARGNFLKKYKEQNPEYFLIGTKNFPLFYKSKDISEYKTFFQTNYL
jgi:outer membrane protein assembly factor BamD (BamD/ComL family)